MTNEVEVPEEAIQAAVDRLLPDRRRLSRDARRNEETRIRVALKVAAPIIRSQERQRVRDALLNRNGVKAAFRVLDPDWPSFVSPMSMADLEALKNTKAALEAALDSLEDEDGEVREAQTFGEDGHDDGATTAAEAFSGPEPLKLAISEEEAKAHGVCPVCEGYGGGAEDDDHPCRREDAECAGSCPQCWCPGCHDGHDFPASRISELDDGASSGSWLAYELIHKPDSNTHEETGRG